MPVAMRPYQGGPSSRSSWSLTANTVLENDRAKPISRAVSPPRLIRAVKPRCRQQPSGALSRQQGDQCHVEVATPQTSVPASWRTRGRADQ